MSLPSSSIRRLGLNSRSTRRRTILRFPSSSLTLAFLCLCFALDHVSKTRSFNSPDHGGLFLLLSRRCRRPFDHLLSLCVRPVVREFVAQYLSVHTSRFYIISSGIQTLTGAKEEGNNKTSSSREEGTTRLSSLFPSLPPSPSHHLHPWSPNLFLQLRHLAKRSSSAL